MISSNKDIQINEEIRDKEVRLIDTNGEQLGIMSSKQALEIAMERELDLVKIAPQAKPPVCKIMDYGKFTFEQSKREKEARKNQKVINVKEIRFSPKIEEHDLNVKARNAQKFLKDGNKVKVTIRFRGREIDHVAYGEKALERFYEILKDYCVIEKPAKLEGKNLSLTLSPRQL
ncbi:MAG: translation initiation factor IF-3 [Clostridiales bacterium]|nr:translation initiation factor IF-3 [Clostridiales bacterium]